MNKSKPNIELHIFVVIVSAFVFLLFLSTITTVDSYALIAEAEGTPGAVQEAIPLRQATEEEPGGGEPTLDVEDQFLYLPGIIRDPSPTPTNTPTETPTPEFTNTPTPPSADYFHDFDEDDQEWVEYETDECEINYTSDDTLRVRARVDGNDFPTDSNFVEGCYAFPGGDADVGDEYRWGRFEVTAWGEGTDRYSYGIYINGRGGGEQYIFRIFPNPGDSCSNPESGLLQFIRNEDGEEPTFGSTSNDEPFFCFPGINVGDGSGNANTFMIEHDEAGRFNFFINGTQLVLPDTDDYLYIDSDPLDGRGIGVFMQSSDDAANTVYFDDFIVTDGVRD